MKSTNAKLKLKNPIGRESITNDNSVRKRENSNESLERIHTFSLKTTF